MTIVVDGDRDGLLAHTTDPDRDVWQSLLDATAGITTTTGDALRIPGWAIPAVAWWWATEEVVAEPPRVTDRARNRINVAAQRADRLQTILDTPRAAWRWPVTVMGADGPVSFTEPSEFGFSRVLRDFQWDQTAQLIGSDGGLNFSVPGAGKTTVAYACLGAWWAAGSVARTVVVAPISAHEAWESEAIACFTTDRRPTLKVNPPRPNGDVVVVHYEALQNTETLTRLVGWLAGSPSVVIFDEAHRVKAGRGGIRGNACLQLAAAATHRLVLTGTPAPNAPSDLEAMFDLAWTGQGRALVRHPHRTRCFVRATKSMLNLPPMEIIVERVPLSDAHRRLYDAAVDVAGVAIADPLVRLDLAHIGRILMLLLQVATNPAAVLDPDSPLRMVGERAGVHLDDLAHQAAAEIVPAKFVRIRQIVNENAAQGQKTLVWANFTHHVAELTRLLADHEPAAVVGSLPVREPSATTDRTRELARWRTDPSCHVLLATPGTLGEGMSLHKTCTRQVHVDRTYNAGVYLQCLDRTHRIGLPPDVISTATILVANNTIDERIEGRLNTKVAAMAALLDDPELVGLSLPDLDDPLSIADLFLDGGNRDDLNDLFAHLHH